MCLADVSILLSNVSYQLPPYQIQYFPIFFKGTELECLPNYRGN